MPDKEKRAFILKAVRGANEAQKKMMEQPDIDPKAFKRIKKLLIETNSQSEKYHFVEINKEFELYYPGWCNNRSGKADLKAWIKKNYILRAQVEKP